MSALRTLEIPCPTCGRVWPYNLSPTEHSALVTILFCDLGDGGCDTHFAAEVRLYVTVEVHTCRLALPSATRPDAIVEVETLVEPEEEFPS